MSAARYAREYAPGDCLSPSQAKLFLSCSAKWAFQYLLNLASPKTGALLQGSAVHEAIAENFRQKIETHQDLPAAGVSAVYSEAWAALREETEFRDDEDEGQLKAEGEQLARLYIDEAAPSIEPTAVELPVEGTIGGVHVRGYVDLLDVDGRVIEIKTRRQKASRAEFNDVLQLSTYCALTQQASGAGRIDVLVKKKRPELVQLDVQVAPADLTMVDRLYPQVQAGIRAQVVVPNRASHLCSRRFCGYWRECSKEFGGTIPE